MSSKNRAFADGLAATLLGGSGEGRARQSRAGNSIIADRNNRLAEVASGNAVARTHLSVDPARCRMWVGHNRDYQALTYDNCRDLIESIKAQSRQEVPAIVRRVQGDPRFDFEVICGARRHFSVTWLNQNNYRSIKFVVEPRELDDEEAFRIADLENRARADLSDYERARDYLLGLDRYYGGQQKAMAARLSVSEAWLSRYLDLARLPEAVTKAFVTPHDIRLKHVMQIKPLIKESSSRSVVYDCALRIAELRAKDSSYLLEAAAVARELANAVAEAQGSHHRGRGRAPGRKNGAESLKRPSDGKEVIRINEQTTRKLQVTFSLADLRSRKDAEDAFKLLADRLWPFDLKE